MKRFLRMCFAAAMAALMILLLGSAGMAEGTSPVFSADDLFTGRDLEQTPDLTDAETLTVASGQEFRITAAGIYVLSGEASDATVLVEAGEDDKVQLVLDGLSVTNADFPVIYVKSADKVFITTVRDSALSVTGSFTADGSTGTDGVIFSKTDLTLNGTASLTLSSLPAPKYWEMRTETPEVRPMKKNTIRLTRSVVLPPTAARACFPTNRPTMMASAVL